MKITRYFTSSFIIFLFRFVICIIFVISIYYYILPKTIIKSHYFSIELLEPGITELSCFTKNFLYRWHKFHPDILFHLYVVGSDLLNVSNRFPNVRIHELNSSLIKDTPLKWWLNEHVYWKYQTAMETTISFDQLNKSYNPSDYPIPMFKHLTLIYSSVLLWHYGGTYISTHIVLIKPISSLISNVNVTLIRRTHDRISLDFLSFLTNHNDIINNFMNKLSIAYQNENIMKIDGELILSEMIKSLSIKVLSNSTFYGLDKDTMFSNWFTRTDLLINWHNDRNRYGIIFPIVRVSSETPIPIKNSLIDELTSLPVDLISSKQISCFHSSIDRIHMGQLVYQNRHNYGNNGDYVQSWVSLQYYPCVDRFFERDNMHNFGHIRRMQLGQSIFRNDPLIPVLIIMNAWWAHIPTPLSLNKFWPPPDHFRPIFISMHVRHAVKSVMKINSRSYIKYGPIGTRDIHTLQFYNNANISAWFSGCLTVSLKFQPIIPFMINTKRSILIVDVWKQHLKGLVPPEILRYHVKYRTAIFKPKYFNEIYEQLEEFDKVRERYFEFLSSKLVITSRLHVLLPCLALKIPVMFVFDSKIYQQETRFQGLIDILVDHVYSENDYLFWKNQSHPYFIDWKNPKPMSQIKVKQLNKMIFNLHHRLKQENQFRIWGRFYQIFD